MPNDLHASESNVSSLELTYEADAAFLPDLDRPVEVIDVAAAAPAPRGRPRGPDGKFLVEPKLDPEATAYQHSRAIARLALDLGYSQEEIDSTPPQMLEDRVYHVNKRTFEILAQNRQQGTAIHADEGGSQPVPEAAEPDLSQFDDTLVAELKEARQARKELRELKARLDQQEQTKSVSQAAARLDRIFGKLDPRVFGKGSGEELRGSDELERRKAVVSQAGGLGATDEQIKAVAQKLFGKTVIDDDAEDSVYDSQPQSGGRVPESLRRRRDEWDEGRLATPSHRKPAPLSAETRAALAAKKYMEEFDLGVSLSDLNDEP